jgi:hypothetical protein
MSNINILQLQLLSQEHDTCEESTAQHNTHQHPTPLLCPGPQYSRKQVLILCRSDNTLRDESENPPATSAPSPDIVAQFRLSGNSIYLRLLDVTQCHYS